jgi:quercetin dioxygenase-like cupin family protein
MAKLKVLHRQTVQGMPTAAEQEVRTLLAVLEPGDRTPRHFHRHPVIVYMLEGAFTLELDGRRPVTVHAGETFVEPAHVSMTGRNLSSDELARMVLFYVSDLDVPFADPVD